MGPRSQFRHDPAVTPVEIVLRSHHGSEHIEPIVDDRRGRFVASGFDGQ